MQKHPSGIKPESWLVSADRPSEPGAPLNVPAIPASNFIRREEYFTYHTWRFPMSEQATIELLKGSLGAFNRHDLDTVMHYFAEDCIFHMPRSLAPHVDRYVGKDELRAGLAKRFEGIPDVRYRQGQQWGCANFGASEWTLTGTPGVQQKMVCCHE